MFVSTITPVVVRPEISGANRTATVEFNQWQRYPWMLRCYGDGVAVTARGIPGHYSDEARARAVADTWVATGVQPADQRAN